MLNVYEEMGETSRRQILAELRSGPKNVSDICTTTGLKQPNVSNHLARMRSRGIVRASKVGRQVFYTLGSPEIEAIVCTVLNSPKDFECEIDFETLARNYAKTAVQGDEIACSAILDQAFRASASLIDIYEKLLTPAMALVGTWWKVQAIDEGQEHLATAITERMMAKTVQVTGPMRRVGKTALLGCAEGAQHTVGLRMISDFLKVRGWRTLFAGANVPTHAFLSLVHQQKPDLVLLSCNADESVRSTCSVLRNLSHREKGLQLGVGGGIVLDHESEFREAGADFVVDSIRDFAMRILPDLEGQSDESRVGRDMLYEN